MTTQQPAMLLITQVKSGIGQVPAARATLRALGLTKIGSTVSQADSQTTRGMIRAVSHLVRVEPAPEAPKAVQKTTETTAEAAAKESSKAAVKSTKAAPKAAPKEVK